MPRKKDTCDHLEAAYEQLDTFFKQKREEERQKRIDDDNKKHMANAAIHAIQKDGYQIVKNDEQGGN